ncbi:MAG: YceD family protein [Pseudohongiellaceae bacterium]|nr:YceD family protein [Pseudohongiellaceae bacterium]
MADTLIPEYVDARKIFAQQATIEGVMPVDRFTRFGEALTSNQGEVSIKLSFDYDERHRRVIDGSLTTQVYVSCQRCMEPTKISLSDTFRLALVESEEQIEKLPKELDPWMSLEPKLVLADIVEEQLILCMPIVSYHDYECHPVQQETPSEETNGSGAEKPNPFAILQTLKDKH